MKTSHILLAALAVVSMSCTKEISEGAPVQQEQLSLSAKLVGGSEGETLPGTLLVRLDAESVKAIEDGRFSDISAEILSDVAATSFSPALPVRPKNIEAARRYGLDQWFIVGFDPQTRPETVAEKIAVSKRVRSVQYSRAVQPVQDLGQYSFEYVPAVRSGVSESEFPFNDTFASYQWNLRNDGSMDSKSVAGADIGVADAWRLTAGDPSVIVAVLDEGIATRHEDLKDAMWQNEAEINGEDEKDDDGNGFIDDKNGFNFVNCFAINSDFIGNSLDGKENAAIKGNFINSTEGSGHGTHVAGIVGAVNNNGKGVSSVAGGSGNGDGVRLMCCQIVQGSSSTSDAQSAAAFIYAADNGACIAQCSYGTPYIITDDNTFLNGGEINYNGSSVKISASTLEVAALQYFLDPENSNHESLEGNIAIFAAGNQSYPYSLYPGALPYVISVTAFAWDFLPGGYTNYGPGCNIAAPGGEWGGVNGDYRGLILSTGVAGGNATDPGVETDRGESRNYVYKYGTSMACPHVSGVIALGVSYAKKLGKKFTREQMHSMLLTSVNELDSSLESGTKSFYDIAGGKFIDLPLDRYYGKMGTGALDAWKFLMAIEGTPSFMAEAGKTVRIDLSRYCNPYAEYAISVDEASRASLGLEADPVIKDGYLEITCSRIGAGKIVLGASVGKDPEKEDGIGEMNYSREISIVSRPFATDNGGWL